MSKKKPIQPRLPNKVETLQDVFNVQDYFKGRGVFEDWLLDANVSPQTLWKWRNGKCNPNVHLEKKVIAAISDGFESVKPQII